MVRTFSAQFPLEAIAVHCTHGFNRSGFLIVSYLVEVMDFHLTKALEIFAHHRYVLLCIYITQIPLHTYTCITIPVGLGGFTISHIGYIILVHSRKLNAETKYY